MQHIQNALITMFGCDLVESCKPPREAYDFEYKWQSVFAFNRTINESKSTVSQLPFSVILSSIGDMACNSQSLEAKRLSSLSAGLRNPAPS
jgi:hypothetical protein